MTTPSLIAETLLTSGEPQSARLTIAIPTYRDDPGELVSALTQCTRASDAHLLIYDDGSADDALTANCETLIQAWPGTATLITGSCNMGRSHARNRLISHSKSNWILFLDADMLPDDGAFLASYMQAIEEQSGPALIAGGFSLNKVVPSAEQSLHAAQSRASECLTAAERAREPGRYVFTSNILVHTAILHDVRFDDEFSGWGWEDVDWGLRVAAAYPVIHIENTATHLGLDDTEVLLAKYGNSGANFARMVSRHPDAALSMSLAKAARRLARLPGRSVIKRLTKWAAKSRLPEGLRLKALKLYRAATYAEHFR